MFRKLAVVNSVVLCEVTAAPPAVMSNPPSETVTVPGIAGFTTSVCLKSFMVIIRCCFR
jgi:hypothetical protein